MKSWGVCVGTVGGLEDVMGTEDNGSNLIDRCKKKGRGSTYSILVDLIPFRRLNRT